MNIFASKQKMISERGNAMCGVAIVKILNTHAPAHYFGPTTLEQLPPPD